MQARRLPRTRFLAASAAAAALAVSGCTGITSDDRTGAAESGELTVLSLGPVATWDPQRLSTAQDIAFAGRVFARTLTAFPAGASGGAQNVEGDLATTAGTVDRTLKTWSFTLRSGVAWQDGSPVTCEDVRYGVSRSFAQPFATEGLTYPLAYLDIPRKADGSSTYPGPYAKDAKGQAAFDKAVSCEGQTVTFRLSTPMADFNQVVALPVFAPVKQAQDKAGDGTYAVFSNGPYQLRSEWDPSAGGTFERNPNWDKGSDPIRQAKPVSIHYIEGTESQTAVQQVINDDEAHQRSVTLDSAPPAMQQHILSDNALKARSVNPSAQFVDYLAPNVSKGVMRNPKAREAFALATNREGYVTALGGASAASAAYTLIGPSLPGHNDADPIGSGPAGDAARARAALQESGLTLPVKVRVAYRSTPTADKAMAALSNGWEDAGFAVQLQPIAKDYFAEVSAPGRADQTDVFWANWAPAWPSASTVIPPLFDSRINVTKSGNGRDIGGFTDEAVNREITRIGALPDLASQASAWGALDASLAKRAIFVALAQRKALYVAGSSVTGLRANEALGGFVDLATVGVK
ncbi:ABC transporter substrate-binding protein [Pedococcus bigeumensis]|uniref:ABC transporter substrate-binding protein n=1 Tax=Pedococcus bigeumensis TaxID=433644 RepID=A0A502CUW2_9MICO|nr:ABC transporter substrate-binding protein [Pedococcus bigeumensis]TPG15909.1 ABC transporter substrate-binding protein [Pedococcus bigeumensis]